MRSKPDKHERALLEQLRVRPGSRVRIEDFDTGWVPRHLRALQKDELKSQAVEFLEQNRQELAASQELLWANDRYAVLVVLQAMDAAGKDGTIKHVMSGVNPQGCQVVSFKRPSAEELDHTFLWRAAKALPARGCIGIFNRSYYEEVLVVRVHPEILDGQQLPPGKRGKSFWAERYEDINAFERHLVRNGTVVLKFFLNVGKAEQKRRFLERLDTPDKNWKFSPGDVRERGHWQEYMAAFEQMLAATSTAWAPWYVIPADHKHVARALVASVLSSSIQALGLAPPVVSAGDMAEFETAREQLLAEDSAKRRRKRVR